MRPIFLSSATYNTLFLSPITKEHSSQKINIFHISGAQLIFSSAHLNYFVMITALIIIVFNRTRLLNPINFSSLYMVALLTFFQVVSLEFSNYVFSLDSLLSSLMHLCREKSYFFYAHIYADPQHFQFPYTFINDGLYHFQRPFT